MKGAAFFLLCFALQARSGLYAQVITLTGKKMPLSQLFNEIEKQTGYKLWYEAGVLDDTGAMDMDLQRATLAEVLAFCCTGKGLSFSIIGQIVVIKRKEKEPGTGDRPWVSVKGKIRNEKDEPLAGASITIKGSARTISTDTKGEFYIDKIKAGALLVISHVGYERRELESHPGDMMIRLDVQAGTLDDVQVIGYGATTQRYSTGSFSRITSKDIAEQPVQNVLSALSGRAAGVFVQTVNGLPGGSVAIQVRGKASILAGTDPLYIIDDVPYPSVSLQNQTALGAGISGEASPFNSINPDDIESITILKDADATAIYGSRGTNGVVLITTKKGRVDKTQVRFNISQGFNKIAGLPKLLDQPSYLQIRHEAFTNDGLIPSTRLFDHAYAPDLLVWDTTKYTNWPKYFLGSTAHQSEVQVSVSGGNKRTGFLLGGNYRNENTVLPGSNHYGRSGTHVSIQHRSEDLKRELSFSGSYTADKNNFSDLVSVVPVSVFCLLPPDFPLHNPDGSLNWSMGYNPLAALQSRSKAQTDNLLANLFVRLSLARDLHFKAAIGFNRLGLDQVITNPASAMNPEYNPVSSSIFGHSTKRTFIVEPQLDYCRNTGFAVIQLLAGAAWQHSSFNAEIINASGFPNENVLENISSATSFLPVNVFTEYKYLSAFARLNINAGKKYLINASVRKDGSSRFGPGYEFGNFGAIAAAWLFSNERIIKDHVSFVSYGKLKMSYGITGNDQITDYQYLPAYVNSSTVYQDTTGLQPNRIANPDFHWESTIKTEISLELGFIRDNILVNINRYNNTSRDQLVNYAIPYITGFSNYEANLPAGIRNSGWEFEVDARWIRHRGFSWKTVFNLTRSRNVLKTFPGISASAYSETLAIGEDITRVYGYRFTGINPKSGVAMYAPRPGSNSGTPYYYFTMGKKTPEWYGGFGNELQAGNWCLNLFLQFCKQRAQGGLYNTPGLLTNNYAMVMGRWQHPDQQTVIPKSTTVFDYAYPYSSANYFNASYIRLKNACVSYNIPAKWMTRLKIEHCRIYLEGQNLYSWWNKRNPFFDPETGGSPAAIPPMRTIIAGIQINL